MRYLTVTGPDINNGCGCRATLWVAGCNHHCPGCHNKHSWEYNQGVEFNDIRERLDTLLSKSYIKGLTLSGGDPLDQTPESLNELYDILIAYKNHYPDKDIWLYTGFYLQDIFKDEAKKKILLLCDVLVEGPYIQEQRDITLPFRGSKNQNIINVKDLQL